MVTSDRIAVMNKGRVEQIDAPHALYSGPRTRFVAEFLGKSNILRATSDGVSFTFEGFTIPTGRLHAGKALGERWFSLRPRDGRLLSAPASDGTVVIAGTLESRSFMGDWWDYGFRGCAGLQLRVMCPPSELFAAGQPVWLSVDPNRLVPLEES